MKQILSVMCLNERISFQLDLHFETFFICFYQLLLYHRNKKAFIDTCKNKVKSSKNLLERQASQQVDQLDLGQFLCLPL
jgi:hypothetical protein